MWVEGARINKDYGALLRLDKPSKRKEQEGRKERRMKEGMREMQGNE